MSKHRKTIIFLSILFAVVLVLATATAITHNNLHNSNPQPIKAPEDAVIIHPESLIRANGDVTLPEQPRTSVTTSPAPPQTNTQPPPTRANPGQPGAVFANPTPRTTQQPFYNAPAPAPVVPSPAPQRPPVAPIDPPVQPVLPPVVERPVERPVEVVKEITPPVVDELVPPLLNPIIDPLLEQIP